ncbi:hypothetical protein Ciccas_001211 [Cichlidogyrus casuarinus]|uniref:Uncharacterized protein n=1 Tax=Cichlidogyrus casuarinus TaxID=1844966 RepID=A0ABD2QKX5_9PLAT
MKELSIRGDFLTTVEYLSKILESDNFISNTIDTEWLDKMIASKDHAEKPNTLLGVTCTSLHVAIQHFDKIFNNFRSHLERGQFLPSASLSNVHDVNLISDGIMFVIKVVRTGGNWFHLICNNQLICVEVYRMSGGGLIVSHENASYMTYCHELSHGYRTVIDNRTCLFEKEQDPSVLRSPSTGKLIQFTVDDGEHLYENEVYALIEIMKLVLELRSPATGRIFHCRSPGAVLEPGMQIAKLKLDDLSRVKRSSIYSGRLVPFNQPLVDEISEQETAQKESDVSQVTSTSTMPKCETSVERDERIFMTGGADSSNDRLHFRFSVCLVECYQVLCGYALPQPYFDQWLDTTVTTLVKCLRDPHLPLLELRALISQLTSRLPASVEKALRKLANQYCDQATSVFFKFPSDRIIDILQQYIAKLQSAHANKVKYASGSGVLPNSSVEATLVAFQEATEPLVELAERYRHGVKGHALKVISNILYLYSVVENHFSVGQFDRCVSNLLSRCVDCASSNPGKNKRGSDMMPPTGPPSPQMLHNSCQQLSGFGNTEELLSSLALPGSTLLSRERMDQLLRTMAEPSRVRDVLNLLFSHHQLVYKNALVLKLIEVLRSQQNLVLLKELTEPLTQLTSLGKVEHATVALAARQFLIFAQTPSYELRLNQVESIFLSSIDNCDTSFDQDKLESLINAETFLFDILMEFLYHRNQLVASAALEVYVRRSYMAYQLRSVQHSMLYSGETFVQFKFLLPNVCDNQNQREKQAGRFGITRNKSLNVLHEDRRESETKIGGSKSCNSTPRRYSVIGLSGGASKILERSGAMAVFETLEKAEL